MVEAPAAGDPENGVPAAALTAGVVIGASIAGDAAPGRVSATAASDRRRRHIRLLLAADAAAIGVSCGFVGLEEPAPRPLPIVILCAVALAGWLSAASLEGLLGRDVGRVEPSTAENVPRIVRAWTIAIWTLFALHALGDANFLSDSGFVVLWLSGAAALSAARIVAGGLAPTLGLRPQNTIVLGAGEVGRAVARKLNGMAKGTVVSAVVDPARKGAAPPPGWSPPEAAQEVVIDRVDDLPALVHRLKADRVVVAFWRHDDAETLAALHALRRLDVEIVVVPRLFEELGPGAELLNVYGVPLVRITSRRPSRAALCVKRLLDVVIASLMLVLLLPVLAVIAVAIKIDSSGPMLYRSVRVGSAGRRFTALKFRTMQMRFCRGARYGGEGADESFELLMQDPALQAEFVSSHKLDQDPRLTAIGGFLRRTSLDELPQLVNVIRGDLSLVGPRPVTVDEWEDRRLQDLNSAEPGTSSGYWELSADLRPGLTGWWQVNGRSALTYQERTRLDFDYAMSWSLKLDLLIMLKTLPALRNRTGAL